MSIQPAYRDVAEAPRPVVPRPAPVETRQAMCVMLTEIAPGEAHTLVRTLRRPSAPPVVVLVRRAGAADVCTLLAGGLRGVLVGPADPEPEPDDDRPRLSVREIGVLRHVADGMSNRDIGDHLGLSALTVKSHLARISRKLGTGDRAELVAIAIRTGLLD